MLPISLVQFYSRAGARHALQETPLEAAKGQRPFGRHKEGFEIIPCAEDNKQVFVDACDSNDLQKFSQLINVVFGQLLLIVFFGPVLNPLDVKPIQDLYLCLACENHPEVDERAWQQVQPDCQIDSQDTKPDFEF